MGIKKYKPTSPGRRFQMVSDFAEITGKNRNKPEKSLLSPHRRINGRNNYGRITIRSRGCGHKRRYRVIDFKRDKDNIPGKVVSLEYDPNRSARIALLNYRDGEKRYIIAPQGLKTGDILLSGYNVEIRDGNTLPLKNIPLGAIIHNIELKKGKGGQLVRSAGSSATLVAKEGNYGHIKLVSGEVRLIHLECRATLGQVSNAEHEVISLGKAGRTRWLGWRPRVRGVAKNPVDHPLGGGEGKTSGGRHPCTPWGKPTKGYKTRQKRKLSEGFIVKKRK